jgi:hypothetical protein
LPLRQINPKESLIAIASQILNVIPLAPGGSKHRSVLEKFNYFTYSIKFKRLKAALAALSL